MYGTSTVQAERAKGSDEYIPAAVSRYDTERSYSTTFWTDMELMKARKSTERYRAPDAATIISGSLINGDSKFCPASPSFSAAFAPAIVCNLLYFGC